MTADDASSHAGCTWGNGRITYHLLKHDLFRKPEPTFRDHALEHDLFRKPERTLRDHTLTIMPAGEARDGAPVLLGRPAAARLPRAGRRARLLGPGRLGPGQILIERPPRLGRPAAPRKARHPQHPHARIER